jgi:hypothetical protein
VATKKILLESAASRLILVAAILVCTVLSIYIAKSFFGATLASRAANKEIATIAVSMAPSDPLTHFTSAVLLERTFLADDFAASLGAQETAVRLSPHDFRYWLELAQAYARRDDPNRAEQAFQVALKLAPNYSRVRWAYGNFLLRQDRADEAFVEIRRAAEKDSAYASSAVAGAWQVFGGDSDQIRRYVGDSANLKAALALVLAREKRFEEALSVWNDVPDELRRTEFKTNGEEIYQRMIEARKFRSAFSLFATVAAEDAVKPALNTVTNGSFELDNPKTPAVFEWQIADGNEPQIGVDNQQVRAGKLSLKMIFNSPDGKAFRPIAQTVAVENGRRYAFEAFYRSELKGAATVKWEILNAADPAVVLASTDAVALTSDWTPLRAEFTVPAGTEAVIIRLARSNCTSLLCPLSGRLWFDEIRLT